MASSKHKLPNLKISIDNTDDVSDSDSENSSSSSSSSSDGSSGSSSSSSGSSSESDSETSVKDKPSVEINVRLGQRKEKKAATEKRGAFSRLGKRTAFQGNVKKYENKEGAFVTGIDVTTKEAQTRRDDRGKRFGIEDVPLTLTEFDLLLLYHSLGVSENDTSERGIRLDTIHMRGVDEMHTKDVFEYFQAFSPGRIEWIDDSSCNVVWEDTMTAARALLGLSKPISVINKGAKKDTKDVGKETEQKPKDDAAKDKDVEVKAEDDNKSEAVQKDVEVDDDNLDLMSTDDEADSKEKGAAEKMETSDNEQNEAEKEQKEVPVKAEDEIPKEKEPEAEAKTDAWKPPKAQAPDAPENLPPGRWRLGISRGAAANMFLRYANKADRKQPGAEKKSKYYVKYGNPNFGGIQGLISGSRKRRMLNQNKYEEISDARDAIRKKPVMERLGPAPRSDDGYDVGDSRKEMKTAQEDSDEGLVDEDELKELLGSSPKKRFMRMHADDEEDAIEARMKRQQRRDWVESSDDSEDDIPPVTVRDARSRISGRLGKRVGFPSRNDRRPTGDLRSRLKQKHSYTNFTVQVE